MLKKKISILLALIMLITSLPGAAVAIGLGENTSSKEILGFYTNQESVEYDGKIFKLDSSYNSVINNSEQISMIAPFWFRLGPEGGGSIEFHKYGFKSTQVDREVLDTVREIKEKDVKVLALVHNMLYKEKGISGKELAHQLLSNSNYRTNFIKQLESLLIKYELDGVNIDIENVRVSDRDNYTSFIKELKETLGVKGYLITVSIPAKTFDDSNNSFSYPFDYKGIGQYADRAAIMTYDEHGAWAGSGAGPIASITWQEKVVRYAVSQMPEDKILLGVPVYGFDWTKGKSWPKYSSYQMSKDTANRYGINILWHEQYKVPYFKYKDQNGSREVWFEDAGSFREKINLMYKYNLRGIAIWRLGMEDPAIWDVVRDEITIAKISRNKADIIIDRNKVYKQEDSILLSLDIEDETMDVTLEFINQDDGKLSRKVSINQQSGQKEIPLDSLSDGWYKVLVIGSENGKTYQLDQKEFGINYFEDVRGHWAKESIIQLYKEGYVKGVAESSFKPEKGLTRAEFTALIARTLNISEPSSGFVTSFKDKGLDNHWARNVIFAMEEKGYIAGVKNHRGEHFANPDQQITRAEMAAMLYNVTHTLGDQGEYNKFTDVKGHWAEKPINSLERIGLISGMGDDRFGPNLTSTRAQAAVIIDRYLELIRK